MNWPIQQKIDSIIKIQIENEKREVSIRLIPVNHFGTQLLLIKAKIVSEYTEEI